MDIDWFSLALGLLAGWLSKVPFLFRFYKKAEEQEKSTRRMIVKMMEMEDIRNAEQKQKNAHLN